jgi:hypothetical protein
MHTTVTPTTTSETFNHKLDPKPRTMSPNQKTYKIALIPGDGIGVDVTEAATQVLQKLADVSGKVAFDFQTFDWSSKTYKEKGYYIPPDGIAQLKKFDSIFFGAVGWPGMFSFFILEIELLIIRYIERSGEFLLYISRPLGISAILHEDIRARFETQFYNFSTTANKIGKMCPTIYPSGVSCSPSAHL